MPEPNLPMLRLCDDEALERGAPHTDHVNIATLRKQNVVMPDERRQTLVSKYGLRLETAHTMVVSQNRRWGNCGQTKTLCGVERFLFLGSLFRVYLIWWSTSNK